MSVHKHSRRKALALALISGFFTGSVALADAPLDDVQVVDLQAGANVQQASNYAPLQDTYAAPMQDSYAAPAETVVVEDPAATTMPEPVMESAPAYEPAAMPCSCCNSTCCTKEKKEAALAKMKGAYKGVFYANDFSYLDDPCYDGPSHPGDSFKRLLNGKLDIGGEARVRYHSENNFRGLGLTGNDDDFFLTRYRTFANLRVNEYFRLYAEYLYADSGGEEFNNRPIEENRGEIQNLFFDARCWKTCQFASVVKSFFLGVNDWFHLWTLRTLADRSRVLEEPIKAMIGRLMDSTSIRWFATHPLNRRSMTPT